VQTPQRLDERVVSATGEEGVVKARLRFHAGRGCIPGAAISRQKIIEGGSQLAELNGSPAFRAIFSSQCLEHRAQLIQASGLGDGQGRHECSSAGFDRQQPLGFEMPDSLAHQRAADAELLAKLALNEAASGRDFVRKNGLTHSMDHLIAKRHRPSHCRDPNHLVAQYTGMTVLLQGRKLSATMAPNREIHMNDGLATTRATAERTRREVLGGEYVDRGKRESDAFYENFIEFTTDHCWGYVWQRPGLDFKTRSMLNLAMLSALARWHEFEVHVRGALNNGVTADEIAEVLLQAGVYAGVPIASEAFKRARDVIAQVRAEHGA
jgi:4-carboxymuconolactone decarboxylase